MSFGTRTRTRPIAQFGAVSSFLRLCPQRFQFATRRTVSLHLHIRFIIFQWDAKAFPVLYGR